MHLIDSAPDGLMYSDNPPDRLHDCCPICDLELCLVDPHPRFGACPCGLARADKHEGGAECAARAAGNDNQGAA